jgi:hypothetical protein
MELYVYDNILDNEKNKQIKFHINQFDITNNKIKGVEFFFSRKDINNPIEQLINDILNKIGDKNEYIEYWYSLQHTHKDMHQDCLEDLYENEHMMINPDYGYILYLGIDSISPTIFFNLNSQYLSCIQSKNNRLVRFKGNIYHSVPRDNYLDDMSFNSDNRNRIVLLFNSWREDISMLYDELNLKHKLKLVNKIYDNPKLFNLYCNELSLWKHNVILDIKESSNTITFYNKNMRTGKNLIYNITNKFSDLLTNSLQPFKIKFK